MIVSTYFIFAAVSAIVIGRTGTVIKQRLDDQTDRLEA